MARRVAWQQWKWLLPECRKFRPGYKAYIEKKKNGAPCMSNIYISLQAVDMFKTLRITQLTTTSTWKKIVMQYNWTFKKCGKTEVINCCLKFFLLPMSAFMRCFSPTKWSHKQQTFKFLHATKVTKSIITVFLPPYLAHWNWSEELVI